MKHRIFFLRQSIEQDSRFPHLLESFEIFFDFPGPEMSWKMSLVLESPGN